MLVAIFKKITHLNLRICNFSKNCKKIINKRTSPDLRRCPLSFIDLSLAFHLSLAIHLSLAYHLSLAFHFTYLDGLPTFIHPLGINWGLLAKYLAILYLSLATA